YDNPLSLDCAHFCFAFLISYVLLFLSFFFFYCSAHHLYLPSFPTRRSSDLTIYCISLGPTDPPVLPGQAASGPAKITSDSRIYIDRKSTRLNSSHEWISYAVFCLKKKKKKKKN